MKRSLFFLSFLLVFVLLAMACTDEQGARRTLEANGYKIISLGGYDAWSKSKDDVYSTKFKAIAPGGQTVTGAVTRKSFGGSTIRLD